MVNDEWDELAWRENWGRSPLVRRRRRSDGVNHWITGAEQSPHSESAKCKHVIACVCFIMVVRVNLNDFGCVIITSKCLISPPMGGHSPTDVKQNYERTHSNGWMNEHFVVVWRRGPVKRWLAAAAAGSNVFWRSKFCFWTFLLYM